MLRQIIGDRAIAAAPGSQTHLLAQSIMRRHDEVAEILAHRPEAYLPMFMQDEGAIIAEQWTIGFMLGVGLRAKAWDKIMLSSFRQTLAPILSVHLVGRRMMPDVPEPELDQVAATAPAEIAQVWPPPSSPQNRLFFFPMEIGRIERSTVLVSGSSRPSSRNKVRPAQRSSA